MRRNRSKRPVLGWGIPALLAAAGVAVAENMMHLQHFHASPRGGDRPAPTRSADENGEGVIDLIETEPMAGTTMETHWH
jgi:hypothetical protein